MMWVLNEVMCMKFMVQGSAGVRGSVHFGLSHSYWAVRELDSFIADTRCTKHSFLYNYTTMIVFKQFKTQNHHDRKNNKMYVAH